MLARSRHWQRHSSGRIGPTFPARQSPQHLTWRLLADLLAHALVKVLALCQLQCGGRGDDEQAEQETVGELVHLKRGQRPVDSVELLALAQGEYVAQHAAAALRKIPNYEPAPVSDVVAHR